MKLLLYCTKSKPYLNDYRLIKGCEKFVTMKNPINYVNGKIVAECDFEVEEIFLKVNENNFLEWNTKTLREKELTDKSCLLNCQLNWYLGLDSMEKKGYAIHIENLHIFSEPRELRFYYQKYKNDKHLYNVENAPQNMMIVIGKQGDKYALISIHPQWLCKILNGEKTIEVRKKVLKGMLENE